MIIKLEILAALAATRHFSTPEPALLNHIRLVSAAPPTVAEFSGAMNELEAQGLIAGARSNLSDLRRWMITDKGVLSFAAENAR